MTRKDKEQWLSANGWHHNGRKSGYKQYWRRRKQDDWMTYGEALKRQLAEHKTVVVHDFQSRG